MSIAIENEVASFAWNHAGPGAQVGHAGLTYMFNQVEGGVNCPMAMVYSAIPSLRTTPSVADEWILRLLSTSYDPRDIPVTEKTGATIGMFMTEKQGGSDVRTNTTRAVAAGTASVPPATSLSHWNVMVARGTSKNRSCHTSIVKLLSTVFGKGLEIYCAWTYCAPYNVSQPLQARQPQCADAGQGNH